MKRFISAVLLQQAGSLEACKKRRDIAGVLARSKPETFNLGPVSYAELYMGCQQEEAWKHTTLLAVALSPLLCLGYALG